MTSPCRIQNLAPWPGPKPIECKAGTVRSAGTPVDLPGVANMRARHDLRVRGRGFTVGEPPGTLPGDTRFAAFALTQAAGRRRSSRTDESKYSSWQALSDRLA